MSWSSRRKLIVFFIIIVALAIVVGLPAFFTFYKAPTCFDGKQNQNEEGIDCGGPCSNLCQAGFAAPQELWATSSQVVSGVYNLLAYAANPNAGVSAPSVAYAFKLYDAQGVLISERDGSASVPASTHFAVFEPTVTTGTRVPYRTFFQFTSMPDYQNAATSTDIVVASSAFSTASTSSRLDASILNSSLSTKSDVEVIAIIYGTDGNVLAFSKTLIPDLEPNTPSAVSFTWPFQINGSVAKKEFLFRDNSSF